MSFTDYFDEAVCINLDRRPDRWELAQEEFKKIGLSNVKRISAVDGKDIGPIGPINAGANGCRMSHLKVLNYAIEKDLDAILVLEDDIEFTENFHEKFSKIESQIPEEFDFLYLGVNPASGHQEMVTDNIYKIGGKYATHAFIIRKAMYKQAFDFTISNYIQVDVSYSILQKTRKAYTIHPNIAYQRSGFSDVEDQEIDYSFFRN